MSVTILRGDARAIPLADGCHDDVLTAAARATGPARFYRLPPGEKRDVLAQAVARLYPTEGS